MKKTLSLLILSSCVLVQADVKVTAADSSGETVMFMNREFVRINIGGVNQSVLYDSQADTFQHLNHDQRSYMEFDQESIKALSATVNAAMKEMKSAMASMPKEQQEVMAKLLGASSLEEPAEPRPVVSKTGHTQTINGVPCVQYAVTLDDDLVSEMWVASYASLGISESDVQGFQKLTAFQERMMNSFKQHPLAGKSMRAGVTMYRGIEGFPLLVKSYDEGVIQNEFKVDSVVNVHRDEGRYITPSDYQKQEMPGLSAGRGPGGI